MMRKGDHKNQKEKKNQTAVTHLPQSFDQSLDHMIVYNLSHSVTQSSPVLRCYVREVDLPSILCFF